WSSDVCSSDLLDLGRAVDVGRMVEELIDDPNLRNDPFGLNDVLTALTVCQSGRPPDRAIAEKALEIALTGLELNATGTMDVSLAAAIDVALAGCGEEQRDVVRAAVSPTPTYRSLLLETSLIRGYALFGHVDQGIRSEE